MTNDIIDYQDKNTLIIGGATGMGGAAGQIAAELGANVYVFDIADVSYPVERALTLDLRNKQAIDSAISELPASVDRVFCCAGVADGCPGLMQINFTGQRYLLDSLLETGRLDNGSSIVAITSVAGIGWLANKERVFEFLDCDTWEEATVWLEKNQQANNYAFSKQAWNAYVAREALNYLRRGVRLNAVLPGPTDTPLAQANAAMWLGFGADYRKAAGVGTHTAEQMANTMVFLGSDAAAGINGITLPVDYGLVNCAQTDAWEDPSIEPLLNLKL